MAKWLRCRINGEERVGAVNGLGSVNLCDGKLFENPKITDEIVSYDDIEILTPCSPSKIIALWNLSEKMGYVGPKVRMDSDLTRVSIK